MTHRGWSLHELQRKISGPVRVRMTASTRPVRQWIEARWRCGCHAEGERIADLLLLERCTGHALAAVPARVRR